MNHLGDTNKMVDTPRTDAHIDGLRRDPELSGCDRTLDFCRQLERELNAANDRIKRLEDAGDRMADVLTWSAAIQYKRSPTVAAWRKAKEDKP